MEKDSYFADIKEMFVEARLEMKELRLAMQETDRKMQETAQQIKETDQQMKETDQQVKKTSRQMEENDRKLTELGIHVNGISDSNGDFAEEFFYNSLEKTMAFAGVRFKYISDKFSRKMIMPDKTEKKAQFDIVLHNGNSIALIEVKYKANLKDVREMVEKKIQDFRLLYPEFARYKLYLGIGSLVLKDRVVQEAKKLGIGLMEQRGDAVEYQTRWVRAY